MAEALHQAIASISIGEQSRQVLHEDSVPPGITQQEVERVVKRVLKNDLESSVVAILKKELKSGSGEQLVKDVVSRTLEKFWEILLTRKSTWQNQLKGK